MILYREAYIDAQGAFETEYVRIKIFTAKGAHDKGDVDIPYFNGQSHIMDVRARTIRPDGSIANFDGEVYDKEIVKGSGIKFSAKTLTLPDVQPGCIIEYKYRDQHDTNYLWSIRWGLQSELYTRLARFSIKPSMRDGTPPLYWRGYHVAADTKPIPQKNGTLALELHDLQGIEEEDLMPPEDTLRGTISFFYRDRDEPSNETPEQYWRRIGKNWAERDDHFVDKKGALESVVSQTVAANDSPEVKLQKLYARAQQIHNTGYDSEKTLKEEKLEKLKENNNVEDVLKHGYATGSQINCLMMGLARAAGFESAIVRVASRQQMPFIVNQEDTNQLPADMVWAKLNGKDLYLDPASKFYPYGLVPWYEKGVNGIRATKNNVEFIDVPDPDPADAGVKRHADVHLEPDGTVAGTIQIDYSGTIACALREEHRDADEAGRKKDLTDHIKESLPASAEFEVTSISAWEDTTKPLHVEGNIKIGGFAMDAGRRILIPLTFFGASEPNAFTHEHRVNAIFFHFPYTIEDSLSFKLPDGLKVESVPSEVKRNPGAGMTYDIKAAQSGAAVTTTRQFSVGATIFPVAQYAALRAFFNAVKTGDDSQIVLQPAQISQAR